MNTVSDFGNIREAVCISAQKIMDACRDQDCMEDLPVYLTVESQETLEAATAVKARSAELLYAMVNPTEMEYAEGHYSVEITYFYRVIADAVLCAVRPASIYGLAVYSKCVTLYGGESGACSFRSDCKYGTEAPVAVVEAVNPVVLSARIKEICPEACPDKKAACFCEALPEVVANAFDDNLVFSGRTRQLLVTMGQFSLVRLQRETQLLIPSYDYCMPERSCCASGNCCPETPCESFAKMQFPVRAFFPEAATASVCGDRPSPCVNGVVPCTQQDECKCIKHDPDHEHERSDPSQDQDPGPEADGTQLIPTTNGPRRR